jgi:hypothetical protein
MAWKADDGSEHTNRMTMVSKNSSLKARKDDASKPPASPSQDPKAAGADPMGSKDLSSDPQALQLVDALKQMGYTGDQVADAMDGGGDVDNAGSVSNGSAAQAAPLQIPGM